MSAYSRPIRFELGPDFMRRIQRMGGEARARLPNLPDINRRAALTRWRRVREAKEMPAQSSAAAS